MGAHSNILLSFKGLNKLDTRGDASTGTAHRYPMQPSTCLQGCFTACGLVSPQEGPTFAEEFATV